MVEKHSPSDSSNHNFLLLRKSAAILGIAAAALGGCTTNIDTVEAQSEQQQSQEPESPISATPEIESPQSTTHIEEEQSDPVENLYKMGPDRVEYQTVLDGFYSYSEDELEDMISSENGYKLRAKYIAALYMKYSYGDKGTILPNNGVNIDGVNSDMGPMYTTNPLFGMDLMSANNIQLNSAVGSIEVAAALEALETQSPEYSGSDDYVSRANKIMRLVAGETPLGLVINPELPGFFGLHSQIAIPSFRSINKNDIRANTITEKISPDKIRNAFTVEGVDETSLPGTDMWVSISHKDKSTYDNKGKELTIIRGFKFLRSEDIYTGDDGDNIDDRIPDFNETEYMPYYAYGEAHPRDSFVVPVPVTDLIVAKDSLK